MDRRDEVRNQVQDNHPLLDYWSDDPGWAAMKISRPHRWATWGALSGWYGGSGWSEPMSSSYGDIVYYEGDIVYSGDHIVATAEEYAMQVEEIVANVPEIAPEKAE